MKKHVVYAWVCFVLFIVLIAGLTGSTRAMEIQEYHRAALSYYGSSGQEVIQIQRKLKNWGYYKGAVDGKYGYQTYRAVRWFQAKNGLKVDGIAGKQTLAAMGIFPAASTPADKNLDLLAHVIHAEARGEPYEGMVAVGAVVLNRVKDSRFPNSIPGVVYQPGAFDCVRDGQINLEPSASAIKAARDAMNGWDPTYGCIYYYKPVTSTSKSITSRPKVTRIGKNNFSN